VKGNYRSVIFSIASSIFRAASGLGAWLEASGAATAILLARELVNVRTEEYEYAVLK
jgi:hypothetical protein